MNLSIFKLEEDILHTLKKYIERTLAVIINGQVLKDFHWRLGIIKVHPRQGQEMSISLNRDSQAYHWMHMNVIFIEDMCKREHFRLIFEVKVCRYHGSLYFPLQEAVQSEKRKSFFFTLHLDYLKPVDTLNTKGEFQQDGRVHQNYN